MITFRSGRIFLLSCAGAASAALLSACGGGGSSQTPTPPVTTFADTSLTTYLPLASGNSWTFNSGGHISDTGTFTLTCTCAINGIPAEELDVFSPSSSYGGSFFFTKVKSAKTSALLATLVGTSTDHGQTLTFITDGTNYGIPVIDDAAYQGENWSIGGSTSTIVSIDGSQQYGSSQYRQIDHIDVDALAGGVSLSWGFGQGVGFTNITENGQSLTLTAFAVNVSTSQSIARSQARGSAMLVSQRQGTLAADAIASRLFTP